MCTVVCVACVYAECEGARVTSSVYTLIKHCNINDTEDPGC